MSVLIPVFPPTAASTIPSKVVGMCTTRTPRSQVAASESGDVGRRAPADRHHCVVAGHALPAHRCHSRSDDVERLGSLAGRQNVHARLDAGREVRRGSRFGPTTDVAVGDDDTRVAPATSSATCEVSAAPTTTSYGVGPPTAIVVRHAVLAHECPARMMSTTSSGARPSVTHRQSRDLFIERPPLRAASAAARRAGSPPTTAGCG